MLMCLGFLAACLGETAHFYISPNAQDKGCMADLLIAHIPNTDTTLKYKCDADLLEE